VKHTLYGRIFSMNIRELVAVAVEEPQAKPDLGPVFSKPILPA